MCRFTYRVHSISGDIYLDHNGKKKVVLEGEVLLGLFPPQQQDVVVSGKFLGPGRKVFLWNELEKASVIAATPKALRKQKDKSILLALSQHQDFVEKHGCGKEVMHARINDLLIFLSIFSSRCLILTFVD